MVERVGAERRVDSNQCSPKALDIFVKPFCVIQRKPMDPLRVEVFVPIRYYGKVHVGSEAQVRPEAPVGGIYSAKVTVVDRVMDAASGTLGVRLRLPNPDFKLPAGVRCKVSFGLKASDAEE